jgi:hypothetical protein
MTDKRYALTIEDSAQELIDHQPAVAINGNAIELGSADLRHRCSGRFSPTARLVLRRLSEPSHAGGARMRRLGPQVRSKGRLALGRWTTSWQ